MASVEKQAPATLSEKFVKDFFQRAGITIKSSISLVVMGGRMYKRESDGLFYLLDNKVRSSDR